LELNQLQLKIAQITANANTVVNDITAQSKRKIAELKEMKAKLGRDVQSALEEVERTLAEDKPRFHSQYGPVFRQLTESSQSLQLFSYSLQTSTGPTVNLDFHLNSPKDSLIDAKVDVSNYRFPAVFGDTVELYDLKSQQFTHSLLFANFGNGGSFTEINRSTLLCVGAYPASNAVYSLNLPFLRFTCLPSLLSPRCGAGIAKAAGIYYAFGSCGKASNSCEKYALKDRQWTALNSMHYPRHSFTPCLFRELIYLLSPATTLVLETFCPQAETFTDLIVAFPPQLKGSFCYSVAFVASGELCLLTANKQMARWKIESEAEFRIAEVDRSCCSTQSPLIVGSMVLIANGSSGRVEKFDLGSYAFL